MLVCGVVVDDEVHVQLGLDAVIEAPPEGEKFVMPMAWLALGEPRAGRDVERCKQRRRAMPDIVMGDILHAAQSHWQHRLVRLRA